MSIRRITGSAVVLLMLGFLVSPARAQISIDPTSLYDFGDVVVGDSRTVQFTVTDNDPESVIMIYSIVINSSDINAFSVEHSGGLATFNVIFTPQAVGLASAELTIAGNVMEGEFFSETIDLSGVGIEDPTSLTPQQMIDNLIANFNIWTTGDPPALYGTGRGKSEKPRYRQIRLYVIKLMLLSAKRLIYRGHYDWAYWQINSILKHADGFDRPWDFVDGDAREGFADDLRDLMSALEGP